MQINTNYTSPNFGMALRIGSEAITALKKADMDDLKVIEKVGKELKNTTDYHLELSENLRPIIVTPSGDRYCGPFGLWEPQKRGGNLDNTPGKLWYNFYKYKGPGTPDYILGQKHEHSYIQYATNKAAIRAYNKIQAVPTILQSAARIVKELDNEKGQIKALEDMGKSCEDKAEDLRSKYGV